MLRLGVSLLLARFGVTGWLADFIGFFLRAFLGKAIEEGIFIIDITLDAIKLGMTQKDFEKEARAAYEKASAKVYTEIEKAQIRQEYLTILDRFADVGGVRER